MENIFAPIANAYYRTALTAAETGKMDVNAAHEVLGMARLYLTVRSDQVDADIIRLALTQHATRQWTDRYACEPDQDFAKAEAKLSKWLRRQLNY